MAQQRVFKKSYIEEIRQNIRLADYLGDESTKLWHLGPTTLYPELTK